MDITDQPEETPKSAPKGKGKGKGKGKQSKRDNTTSDPSGTVQNSKSKGKKSRAKDGEEEDLLAKIKRLESRVKTTELLAAIEIRKLKEDFSNANKYVLQAFCLLHMYLQ